MTLRLAIIADDLTGALDAAAPFADAGLRVRVATSPSALGGALPGAEVVAVSTRSREIGAGEAAAAVRVALEVLPAGVRLFKKVDSRLKGNIAAELAVFPEGPVLAVPAIPEFGRVVRDGAVRGVGVAVPLPVAEVLGRVAAVPNIVSQDEMLGAVRGAGEALIVGARGAALALAAVMGRPQGQAHRLPGSLLIAVGSTDPITLAQVARLREARSDIVYIAAPDGRGSGTAGAVTLVQAVAGQGASGAKVARNLASTVQALLPGVRTLVVTGGATAEAVLDGCGIEVLDLAGEILPGLPVAQAAGLVIVTKSGGFGEAGTLCSLVEAVR